VLIQGIELRSFSTFPVTLTELPRTANSGLDNFLPSYIETSLEDAVGDCVV
jgi:hypothetical protein